MVVRNFRYFALHYLNDWIDADKYFVDGLMPDKPTETRLQSLLDAAKYYKVVRNFKTLDGEVRLTAALGALDAVPGPISDETADAAVSDLAEAFRLVYGRNAISAASKFLWLRHKWPVVIYDSRAIQCLWASGCEFYSGDYAAYRKDWRLQFAEHEQEIRSACSELVGVKGFSLAGDMPSVELEQLTSMPWFLERVFDKFLWANSDEG